MFTFIKDNFLIFNPKYFLLAILMFVLEVIIAMYVHDNFVRPFVGDFLVVILMYCFLKSFLNIPVWTTASMVFIFSFFIEITQYFNLIEKLDLQNSTMAKVIIGNSFSWIDLLLYILGIFTVIVFEKK